MRSSSAFLTAAVAVVMFAAAGCNHDSNGGGGGHVGVADRTFNQLENCSEAQAGSAATCILSDGEMQILITNVGGNNYQAVTVPDSGYTAVGTIDGTRFTYHATHTAGYTEEGTIFFNDDGTGYSGTSTYTANDNSFSGECTFNGAIVPDVPPPSGPVGACQ